MENLDEYLKIAGMVISVAAAIAAVTPTQKDDTIIGQIMKVINVLGLNIGNAKNKK